MGQEKKWGILVCTFIIVRAFLRHVPALTLKYTLQKLQSALNQAKTQGVILDSEVTFVNKELWTILKDNLHKMGSKDEMIKLENLQDEKARDHEQEDFTEPDAKPIVIDITPKKPQITKPQAQAPTATQYIYI